MSSKLFPMFNYNIMKNIYVKNKTKQFGKRKSYINFEYINDHGMCSNHKDYSKGVIGHFSFIICLPRIISLKTKRPIRIP